MNYLLGYLLLINIVSGIVFWSDKRKARQSKKRIQERTLHFYELLGGVFSILFLMYQIRHKNKKKEYFLITYFIALVWVAVIGFVVFKFLNL